MHICAYRYYVGVLMRDITKAFKSLSDETRLRIMNVLLQRECCVCEVMQALDISQTRASRNLGILHDAGFLTLRKEGLWSYYNIDREGMKDYLDDLVRAVGRALNGQRVAARDLQRLQKAVRVGPGCVAKDGTKEAPA